MDSAEWMWWVNGHSGVVWWGVRGTDTGLYIVVFTVLCTIFNSLTNFTAIISPFSIFERFGMLGNNSKRPTPSSRVAKFNLSCSYCGVEGGGARKFCQIQIPNLKFKHC